MAGMQGMMNGMMGAMFGQPQMEQQMPGTQPMGQPVGGMAQQAFQMGMQGAVAEAKDMWNKGTTAQCTCGGAADLFDAAQKCCTACSWKYLFQAGETRDNIHFEGWNDRPKRTALMVAAYYGNVDCVKMLAQQEDEMRDAFGNTALMVAAWKGCLECVKILAPLQKGVRNNAGFTALMHAAD